MTTVYIICATILVIITLILLVTKDLVNKYLDIKKDTYRDMDVLHSERLNSLESSLVTLVNYGNLREKAIKQNSIDLSKLNESTGKIPINLESNMNLLLDSREELGKELADIKGKVASQQVASVFSPKRRG